MAPSSQARIPARSSPLLLLERSGAEIDGKSYALQSASSEMEDDSGIRVDPEVELFANALDDCLAHDETPSKKRERILLLVSAYYDYALNRLQSLRRAARRTEEGVNPDDNEMDLDEADEDAPTTPEDIQRWEYESRVWNLLAYLLPLRYPDPASMATNTTPVNLWHEFLDTDPAVRERAAVLEWLQDNAASRVSIDDLLKDLQRNANRGDILSHGWLHTNKAIKLWKNLHNWPHHLEPDVPQKKEALLNSDNDPLVTQLDPDSATRQGRKLQPEDQFFERALWLGCFELLRRGSSLEKIREWCLERTEAWRAVSLSPWPLSSRPDGNLMASNGESLALWRRTCYALVSQGGTDDFERAVYGLLSGDIQSVEKVSSSWDDFLFANYNALLRTQFDDFILSKCSPETSTTLRQTFTTFDAVRFHGHSATVDSRLVRSLESDDRTNIEARDPMVSLQGAIISKQLARHLYEQGEVLAQHANTKNPSKIIPRTSTLALALDTRKFIDLGDHHGLRVMTHVLIVLSKLDALGFAASPSVMVSQDLGQKETQENVIAAYASYLRLAGLEELIPLYCSTIGGSRIYSTLSRNLIHIADPEGRQLQLNLIRKAKLDALEFVKTQPQLIFDDLGDEHKPSLAHGLFKVVENGPPSIKYGRPVKTDFFGDDPDSIDRSDELLIRSVEWLLLVEAAWPDVFAVGTRVYKYFLRRLRLNAARAFASRVPFAEVMGQRVDLPPAEDLDHAWFDEPDIWGGDALDRDLASDARSFWELESLVKVLDTMETLASLAELSKEDSSAKRDFWSKVGQEVKAAKVYIRPLLRNWLQAGAQGDKELLALRDAFLPETILAYVSALHFAGTSLSRDNLLECMELASVIAEKDSDVASCFVKANRMKELVESFASCSKALAIVTGEKKGGAVSSKKLREMGWSRDLWSVRQ